MKLRAALLLSGILLFPYPGQASIADRPEVQSFIDEMATNHQFDRAQLTALFAAVEVRQDILTAISRPAESKPWFQYRPIFLTRDRIEGGVEFWKKNRDSLEWAEKVFGVPAPIIVAILGVETRYGRHAGRYRVIDALSTLAFDYPQRAPFFRGQLEQYLLMTREENVDPLQLIGSYAGAMGQPQFMPSSFRRFAIDFDNNGRRDLWQSSDDVIGSVANYFRRHGWQSEGHVVHRATVSDDRHLQLLARGLKPSVLPAQLAEYGVATDDELDADGEVALVRLEVEGGAEYWLACNNFYVITRYNQSALYAMAVYELSQALSEEIKKQQ